MIGAGVSNNRVVSFLDDGLMAFLDSEATATGFGKSHVVRKALRLLQSQVRREIEIAEIEASHG
jgi:hypothetical protein